MEIISLHGQKTKYIFLTVFCRLLDKGNNQLIIWSWKENESLLRVLTVTFSSIDSAGVKTYSGEEQITTDTTSNHIKDYHHKNDRIKVVKIGFEAPSGDVPGWMENEGVEERVNICWRLLHAVFAGGIVSTHRLQPRIWAGPQQMQPPLYTHTHSDMLPYIYPNLGGGRIEAPGQFS